jgi:hypothetical protein
MAKTALPVASAAIVANGLQGTYLHARGIAQKPGGWSNARYNLEMGPPLDLRSDPPGSRVPVVNLIDSRLAEQQTDGWHYDGMPQDGDAWRASLAALDADARARRSMPTRRPGTSSAFR